MARVLVIHRDPPEANERAARLRALGLDATPYLSLGSRGFRGIHENPPHVILIDLTRLPSYGKAMGVLIRKHKLLRSIPLVFVEGDPDKVAQVRAILPDAVYTPWAKASAAIQRAIRQAPPEPLAPRVPSTPLLAKLGIGENSRVALLHSPKDFELPGVTAQQQADGADVVLIFFRKSSALSRELPDLPAMTGKGRRLWVLWPKKASGVESDLTLVRIREMASAHGLVDYKVCAVDAVWSATTLGKRRRQ